MPLPGQRNKKGWTLRLPGAFASIWIKRDSSPVVVNQYGEHTMITVADALSAYNKANGTEYSTLPKLPIPDIGGPQQVPSSSTPGKFYTITQGESGALYCTCPGFGYRRTCSHIDIMKELLGVKEDEDINAEHLPDWGKD